MPNKADFGGIRRIKNLMLRSRKRSYLENTTVTICVELAGK